MTPLDSAFNVVLLGNWNPAIFQQPKWLQNNVFNDGEDCTLKVGFPLLDPSLPTKISVRDFELDSSSNRLQIHSSKQGVEGLSRCIWFANSILKLLPHTPIHGVGVNFGYEETENIGNITERFDLKDQADIDADEYDLIETRLTRRFKLKFNFTLGLTIVIGDDSAIIDLNFDSRIEGAAAAQEAINTYDANEWSSLAKGFVEQVYGKIDQGDN